DWNKIGNLVKTGLEEVMAGNNGEGHHQQQQQQPQTAQQQYQQYQQQQQQQQQQHHQQQQQQPPQYQQQQYQQQQYQQQQYQTQQHQQQQQQQYQQQHGQHYAPPQQPPASYGAPSAQSQQVPYGHLNTGGYTGAPGAASAFAHTDSAGLQAAAAGVAPPASRMRRALFIGINYVGSKHELSGCFQDVRNIRAFFQQRFPNVAEQRVMTDERGATTRPEDLPTRRNMLAAFQWLVAGARPGDHFFLHYSGHGGSMPDDNGDEEDGQDETVLPVDWETAGQMRDDELHAALCEPLPAGAFLTCIFDCCHSGTMLDLPFTYVIDGADQVVTINNFEVGKKVLLQGGLKLLTGDKQGAMQLAMQGVQLLLRGAAEGGAGGGGGGGPGGAIGAMLGNILAPHQQQQQQQLGGGGGGGGTAKGLAESRFARKATNGTVVQWSGCRDDQTSADTTI
ncbi:Ca(2+)-dependent cysteine protease, partial [Cladochytrium tenue]